MSFINSIFDKLSKGSHIDVVNEVIIGNMIGFYRVDSSVNVSQMILEIAKVLSSSGRTVCIIETNPLSDFYLSKFNSKLKSDKVKEVPGIGSRFMNSSSPLSSCLIDGDSGVKVLTFANTSYMNAFDMNYGTIEKTYMEVKDNFDIVLVDICNLPVLETVVAAVKNCSYMYSIWDMNASSYSQHMKIMNFFSISNLQNKFCNVIVADVAYGVSVIDSYRKLKLGNIDFELEIPEINSTREEAENVYVLDKISGKSAIKYAQCIDIIVRRILNVKAGES